MDLRSLMNKLDTIAERSLPMPGDGGRAQYDKFKADDARAAAVAQVKQWMSTPLSDIARLGVAIDPKTGIIYYGDAGNGRQFTSSTEVALVLDSLNISREWDELISREAC
jgi:hypothetical protein